MQQIRPGIKPMMKPGQKPMMKPAESEKKGFAAWWDKHGIKIKKKEKNPQVDASKKPVMEKQNINKPNSTGKPIGNQ